MIKEIVHFLLHLRLHYQLCILPGGYLLGGLLADQMHTVQFWIQFLNVHILLFGGATAYNSFWDKDEGPIGGLKHPPKMTKWMHPASVFLMIAGWIWAYTVSFEYFAVFGLSGLFFWLYSTPHARWKGHPLLSLAAIGFSTGFNSVLLGFWAAGGEISAIIFLTALGASLILLSLYPVSQIYQSDEDTKRGDVTFYLKFGIKAVHYFYSVCFLSGLILISLSMAAFYEIPAVVFFIIGLFSFFILKAYVKSLKGMQNEYQNVMKIKFFASFSFVIFLLAANAVRYEWLGRSFLNTYF